MWLAAVLAVSIVAIGAYLRGYCDGRAEHAEVWKQIREELRDF